MPLFGSQENDKEKRLPGWEDEPASDDFLSPDVKRKLESFKVPKEQEDDTQKGDRS